MKVTLLGTGTSCGTPVVGCQCFVCRSTDPRDRRLRSSALIQTPSTNLLVDCGPDFRQQMLSVNFHGDWPAERSNWPRADLGRINGVLITHEHYDHVGGIDDLRPLSYAHEIPLYANAYSCKHLRERIPYCFAEHAYPGVPRLRLVETAPGDSFTVGDIPVTAIEVMHGNLPILGFRIGDLGYITDMKSASDDQLAVMHGVRTLVINGLRHRPHHSHQTIEQACRIARWIGPQPTYLIHMCHDIGLFDYEESWLPEGIHLAYDGLSFEI